MNVRTEIRMDKAQFFAWLEHQERKHELADGRVLMLPNVTRNHWRIASNILVALSARLDRSRFDVGLGDFAVDTGERSIRYADAMVTPIGTSGSERTTHEALLLVEIASPSTVHIDFGDKLREYQTLASLGCYAICAQDEARVWIWTRAGGEWPNAPNLIEGLEETIDVPSLGISLPLAEVYQNIKIR
jgi:Uma2 family endonuclease